MKFTSEKIHTIIGLIVGVVLILAPGVFSFANNQAASMSAIWIGIFLILSELVTTSPYSLAKLVPMKIHTYIDVATGFLLLLSPWLFNFMAFDDYAQWVPHVVVGLIVIGYALLAHPSERRIHAIS